MSNNKFDALGSDESEGDETMNNHHQLEVSSCNLFLTDNMNIIPGGAGCLHTSGHTRGPAQTPVPVLPVVFSAQSRKTKSQFRPEPQTYRAVRELRAVLESVQSSGQAGGPRQPLGLPPLQDGHQADVGGRGQQVRWQVDSQT